MAYINTTTNEYPVSEQSIRELFANTSFGIPFIPPSPYEVVFSTPSPVCNSWEIIRETLPVVVGGHYEQQWELIDVTLNMSPEELAAFVQQMKVSKKEAVTRLRKSKEEGGITLPSGMVLNTNTSSQSKVAGAKVYVDMNPAALIDWKADSGWVQIDAGDVSLIANAVGAHVQNCFSVERTHHEAIDALTTKEEVEAYDVTTGW